MELHEDTTFLQVQTAVRHSKHHHIQAGCKLIAFVHTLGVSIQYPAHTDTHPYHAAPALQGLHLSHSSSDMSFHTSLKSLLHPALPSTVSALNRRADASLGMSAGVCPNEAGVKSLPSASLLSSLQLSSVSNIPDVFLFLLKKKKKEEKVIYFLITKEYRIK